MITTQHQSCHDGAIARADTSGKLVKGLGPPQIITYIYRLLTRYLRPCLNANITLTSINSQHDTNNRHPRGQLHWYPHRPLSSQTHSDQDKRPSRYPGCSQHASVLECRFGPRHSSRSVGRRQTLPPYRADLCQVPINPIRVSARGGREGGPRQECRRGARERRLCSDDPI